jgi:hypothetical protein
MAADSLYSPSQVGLIRCLSFGFTAALFRKLNNTAIRRSFQCTAVRYIFYASTYLAVSCSVRLFMKFFPGSNSVQNTFYPLRFTRPVSKHCLKICHLNWTLTPHGCVSVLSFVEREEAMHLGNTIPMSARVYFPISNFEISDYFYEIWGDRYATEGQYKAVTSSSLSEY